MALKDRFKKYIRVLRVTKKPDAQEFMNIAKITSLGILVIGLLGFLINTIANLI